MVRCAKYDLIRSLDEVIGNWQAGHRVDGDSPVPSVGRCSGDGVVDWDLYVAADEIVMEQLPEVRACFWAVYAPGHYNRANHRQSTAHLDDETRRRYVDLVRYRLERALCRRRKR